MAAALARLEDMKRKYHMQLHQADHSPSLQSRGGREEGGEAVTTGSEACGMEGGGQDEGVHSPAPDVQAIRNRLARLKAAPRAA